MAMTEEQYSTNSQSVARTDTGRRDLKTDSGYHVFYAGAFEFRRDEYLARIAWPGGTHVMPIDAFLRALMRDVAWSFFYGVVNFDGVFGTINHYGEVTVFAGRFNEAYRKERCDHEERFQSAALLETFQQMLGDRTNQQFDPFVAPMETGVAWGPKNGGNPDAIGRNRVTARRMVGLPGDTPIRSDEAGFPVNRQFSDLFAYLSRSNVTWNPSVCSVVGDSLFCPTSEEFILPVEHGNDRVKWFLQLSDEILWDVKDKETGRPRARVLQRAGRSTCASDQFAGALDTCMAARAHPRHPPGSACHSRTPPFFLTAEPKVRVAIIKTGSQRCPIPRFNAALASLTAIILGLSHRTEVRSLWNWLS